MVLVKCEYCGNHYSDNSGPCPFCSSPVPLPEKIKTLFTDIQEACYVAAEGTNLTEDQKQMVVQATADIHRKGSHPKRNKAHNYLPDEFDWFLYNQWLEVFTKSSGLEQWPAAKAFQLFEQTCKSKNARELLAELTKKQIRELYSTEAHPIAKLCTKSKTIKKVLTKSEPKNIRRSALAMLHNTLKEKAIKEKKELFSSWLLRAGMLNEKMNDWKEFNVERVQIQPASDACQHCKKFIGREMDIEQALPFILSLHPGTRCQVVLATSEFSRLV